MAICYFNDDYDQKYQCNYEVSKNSVEVLIDYDIEKEIESQNGVIALGPSTEFRERDILIIDSENKSHILLKKARYAGHYARYGSPDDITKTKFFSYHCFQSSDCNNLVSLLLIPKASGIRVFCKTLNKIIGHPTVETINTADDYIIKLKRNPPEDKAFIGCQNIRTIGVTEIWSERFSYNDGEIQIHFNEYIELKFYRRVNYDEIQNYINELLVYLQLYLPGQFIVEKVEVNIDKHWYGFITPFFEVKKKKECRCSVDSTFLDFLKNCYEKIPYRNGKTEVRSIPNIVLVKYRGIEDEFLLCYRFIECYYKKQPIPDIERQFIKYALQDHGRGMEYTKEEIAKEAKEIVTLRNHYVHSGYYIKNQSLRIRFDRKESDICDYTVNNINFEWLYKKVQLLYRIVINMIFVDLLGYDDYRFDA